MPRNPKSLKNLKSYKKGETGNPLGAKLHNPVFKALKNIARKEFAEIIEVALTQPIQNLKRLADDDNLPAVQMGVVRALYRSAIKGEWNTFRDIVEQLVGKNPDVFEYQGMFEAKFQIKIPKTELEKEVGEIVKELRENVTGTDTTKGNT
jgi:hypothetical protein